MPHSRVNGQMTADACTGKEGLDVVGVFDRGTEALLVKPGGAWLVLLLALRPCMMGRSLQWPPLVKRDAEFFPTPRTLGLLLSVPDWYTGCFGDVSEQALWALILLLLGKGHSLEHLLIGEGEVTTSPPPSTPSHSWLAGMAPSSRWINLLCPMLEGPGICHHFLLGNFSNIPACID